MSKAMSVRPSSIYRIKERFGEFAEYCFDSAVIAWGTAFDAALEGASGSAKTPEAGALAQSRVVRQWLGAEAAGGYRDPSKR